MNLVMTSWTLSSLCDVSPLLAALLFGGTGGAGRLFGMLTLGRYGRMVCTELEDPVPLTWDVSIANRCFTVRGASMVAVGVRAADPAERRTVEIVKVP